MTTTILETEDIYHRSLAGGGGEAIEIDYTIFATAVMTMGLLLIVEVIRHRIDKIVEGNDFFETMLSTVYHELSTLGMVEATVFIIHQYYADLDLKKERIFADVHFTLFFVAIINALMSCILYFLSLKVAENQWVKMEALDINHYVAFRKQFDQVKAKIEIMEQKKQNQGGGGRKERTTRRTSQHSCNDGHHEESFFDNTGNMDKDDDYYDYEDQKGGQKSQSYSQQQKQQKSSTSSSSTISSSSSSTTVSDKNFVAVIGKILNKPLGENLSFGHHNLLMGVLRKKYAELLIQLRFHELRVHFIEKHHLPSNFKVSNYLKLAMNDVFKEFVHVSTRTWIALMGFANFLYFLMGIITLATASPPPSLSLSNTNTDYDATSYTNNYNSNINTNDSVRITLSWIYLGYCIAFIFISYFISIKMGNIFTTIIQKDSWVQVVDRSERNLQIINSSTTATTSNRDISAAMNSDTMGGTSLRSLVDDSSQLNIQLQKDYFWFGKPDLIITFAQLMQFGYSVGFAILLVFSKTVESGNIFRWWGWYAIAPVISFLLFVWIWSVTILEYTQCTSLGDLVRKKHLIDIDAQSKLEEECIRRQDEIDHIMAERAVAENMKKRTTTKKTKTKKVRIKSKSLLSLASQDESLAQIAEFVKKPTKDLPRTRIKSTSNGVASMVSLDEDNGKEFFFSNEATSSKRQKSFFGSKKDEDKQPHFSSASFLGDANTQPLDNDASMVKKSSLRLQLLQFFLSATYRQASAVFGTMVAFYMIAFRLQKILIKTCKLEDKDNVWEFSLNHTSAFYILIGCFCLFIVESLLVIILFRKENGRENVIMVVAGLMDIIITSICIGLLLVAEHNRCCDYSVNDSYPSSVVSSNIFGDSVNDGSYASLSDCSTDNACCPFFGSRLCGGIGPIEPIISIITFRLFRFLVAEFLCRYFKSILKKSTFMENQSSHEIGKELSSTSIQFKDLIHESGTMAELWVLALTQYSDIAKTHGIFSGYLLEAMLGIDPLPEGQPSVASRVSLQQASSFSANIGRGIICERPYFQLVRSMRRCYCKWKPFLDEEWNLVDVVLTEHEIVWFDAQIDKMALTKSDIEEMHLIKKSMHANGGGGKNLRLYQVSIGRTIIGRFSLSDLEYAKVERSIAPQFPEPSKISQNEDNNIKSPSWFGSEYWSSPYIDDDDDIYVLKKEQYSLGQHRTEDRLKIQSASPTHSTLNLRFLSDMSSRIEESSMGQQYYIDKGEHTRNEALSWCNDIVHFCGHLRSPVTGNDDVNEEREEQDEILSTKKHQDSIESHNAIKAIFDKMLVKK